MEVFDPKENSGISWKELDLLWTKEMRHLGIFIVQSKAIKCGTYPAKCSCHKAANYIFGNVGKLASKEVKLPLIKRNIYLDYYIL